MQPIELTLNPGELIAKAIKKAGGHRALEREIGLSRTTWHRLHTGETKRLNGKTKRLLIEYVYG